MLTRPRCHLDMWLLVCIVINLHSSIVLEASQGQLKLKTWVEERNSTPNLVNVDALSRRRRSILELTDFTVTREYGRDNKETEIDNDVLSPPALLRMHPAPRQQLRLWGSKDEMNSNKGDIQYYDTKKRLWRPICDDYWDQRDANVVCQQLGFVRGAFKVYRGAQFGSTEKDFIFQKLDCRGHELRLEDCHKEDRQKCSGSAAGALCYLNEGCERGWSSFSGACYKVNTVPLAFYDAAEACSNEGAKLAYVMTMEEHQGLTNILSGTPKELKRLWTGGQFAETMIRKGMHTSPAWIYVGTDLTMVDLRLWFPGFTGDGKITSIPTFADSTARSCIAISHVFHSKTGTESLSIDDYWLDNLSCKIKLPYICQKTVSFADYGRTSDCYNGNGADYRGFVSRTVTGTPCAKWDHSASRLNSRTNPNAGLGDHNYCRNPDADNKPWCWTHPYDQVFAFCDIRKCGAQPTNIKKEVNQSIPSTPGFGKAGCSESQFYCPSNYDYGIKCQPRSAVCDGRNDCRYAEDEDPNFCRTYSCKEDEYFCESDEFCIKKALMCDGYPDCSDLADERNCSLTERDILRYKKYIGQRLTTGVKYVFYKVSLEYCLGLCDGDSTYWLPNFTCKSFNYRKPTTRRSASVCELISSNLEDVQNKLLIHDGSSTFYNSKVTCSGTKPHSCANKKCISSSKVCNGVNDCGDGSDEEDCPGEMLPVKLRLRSRAEAFVGRLEVRYRGEWGQVCDDHFDIKSANVACRQLGFRKATRVYHRAGQLFTTGNGKIFLDDVQCKGNEERLEDCHHSPWYKHNCSPDEVVALECDSQRGCDDREIPCSDGSGCIKASQVCDGQKDCSNGSDEPRNCTLTIRLEGGANATSGRVVLVRGSITGTICRTGFTNSEATVVCRMLGHEGCGKAVTDGTFGNGTGFVMLDGLRCLGTEALLTSCPKFRWGDSHCSHDEDVGVVCGTCSISKRKDTTTVSSGVCGKRYYSSLRNRVVGGHQAVANEVPWQAGIRKKYLYGNYHYCGGTILNDKWILSAAHCFKPGTYKRDYLVRVGDLHNERSEIGEQEFAIDVLIKHPKYVSNTKDNDFAMVKIAKSNGKYIQIRHSVIPACLPSGKVLQIDQEQCIISGWGKTEGPSNKVLRAADVGLIEKNQCSAFYNGKITTQMVCAGYEAGGIDTCQGDSGGPLVCLINGTYTVVGTTSFGYGCGKPGFPGVYAKVEAVLSWIHKTMADNP